MINKQQVNPSWYSIYYICGQMVLSHELISAIVILIPLKQRSTAKSQFTGDVSQVWSNCRNAFEQDSIRYRRYNISTPQQVRCFVPRHHVSSLTSSFLSTLSIITDHPILNTATLYWTALLGIATTIVYYQTFWLRPHFKQTSKVR